MLYSQKHKLKTAIVFLKNFFLKFFHKKTSFYRERGFCDLFIKKNKFSLVVFLLFLSFFFLFAFISAPNNFPVGAIVTAKKGETVSQIAKSLEEKKVIRSAFVFTILSKLLAENNKIMAGDYFFEQKCSVICVVRRMATANCGIEPTRFTFVEGSTIYDIAESIKKQFPNFSSEEFLEIAENEHKEGYLFPDTYYFLPNVTPEVVIATMENNFYEKIKEISDNIKSFGKSLHDVVVMASLLEKEARTLKTKRIVSGILWKRIAIGMPLQVDAVFPYIIGKNTYEVSLKDLEVESPYNTYANKGLPIGPIANPSLWSLLAAVTPIETDYLFYLSDREGNMHYGVDFEEHKGNRVLYLD